MWPFHCCSAFTATVTHFSLSASLPRRLHIGGERTAQFHHSRFVSNASLSPVPDFPSEDRVDRQAGFLTFAPDGIDHGRRASARIAAPGVDRLGKLCVGHGFGPCVLWSSAGEQANTV